MVAPDSDSPTIRPFLGPSHAPGHWELLATCAFGLEAIVRRELKDLGIDSRVVDPGKILFHGNVETLVRANLWLRCADRVLIRVATFDALDFDLLFETTRALPWGQVLPVDAAFPVTGRSVKSQLSSVPAVQRSVKKAIVEAMQRDHATQQLSEQGAEFKIDISLLKDQATLTIDTTGRSLHRRGYRTLISEAPLKETLASAMVLLSYWKPGRRLVDPFCGSGTIPIEAARIGRRMAPGLDREFAFQQWALIDPGCVLELREEARQQILPPLEVKLLGSDIDGRALKAARDNAIAAGVDGDIEFQRASFQDLSSSKRFGCVITNPPYGERLGDNDELFDLYRSIPEVLRGLPTWSHYFLTAYPDFESMVGRKADRRRKLYNGRIECTYFQFQGPKPITGKGPAATGIGQSDNEPDAAGVEEVLAPDTFAKADSIMPSEDGRPVAESQALPLEQKGRVPQGKSRKSKGRDQRPWFRSAAGEEAGMSIMDR